MDLRPHKSRYWLTSKDKLEEQFDKDVAAVCDVYRHAQDLAKDGVHVVSTDE